MTDLPNLSDPDRFYAALLAAHEGLDEADSAALNARLILIFAHEIGDMDRLEKAISLAVATKTTGSLKV